MLRINREKTNSPKTLVKNNCANYNTGFICSGAMILRNLKLIIDENKANKPCLVADGKECDYYDQCVKPIV